MPVTLSELSALMDKNFTEVNTALRDIATRLQQMELREAGCSPLINNQVNAAHRRLDDLTPRIKALEDAVIGLQQSNRILSWLGGILGSAVILWLIGSILAML